MEDRLDFDIRILRRFPRFPARIIATARKSVPLQLSQIFS
jgi:hypothetical protein